MYDIIFLQMELAEILQFDDVSLVPRYVQYVWNEKEFANALYPEVKLNQFDLDKKPYMVAGENNKSIEVKIPMKRLPEFHGITTFMPTLFLFIISCSILFIKEGHFEATVALALTTMLVMLTLHQSVSDDLPQTAYVKFIDFWLIAGMVVPFIVFLVVIVLELIPDTEGPTRHRIQKCCQFCIPSATLLFVIMFFAYAIFLIS